MTRPAIHMRKLLTAQTSAAPLAVFRVLFGFIMAVSILRFAWKGWIYDLYVAPTTYFTFFEWVVPVGEAGMYALFLLMGLGAVGIMLGLHYRVSVVLFFLAFTYVELIDKTNYLNHYYFVSVISFLLIWVPAHRHFSLDVWKNPALKVDTVPAWTVNILKLQIAIVYVYAGLAKLNPDWLFEAMPLRLWLPAHAHLPVIGGLLAEPATAYLFSWAGAFYDLTIVFLLLWSRTRIAAYAAVVVFHVTTAVLFQIGMFPYIMILATLIFFPADFHERGLAAMRTAFRTAFGSVLERMRTIGGTAGMRASGGTTRMPASVGFGTSIRRGASVQRGARPRTAYRMSAAASAGMAALLCLHFAIQIAAPLRAAAYPGNHFWTEEGYRFSWRVMLMEKAGYATFHVHDPTSGRSWQVSSWEYLTPHQEKMMATQPDMILQFAHFLEDVFRGEGMGDVEIRAEAYVTLNGRKSRLLIDPQVDLTDEKPSLLHKEWILPFADDQERWIGRR